MSGISNRLKLLEKLLADLESDEAMLLTQLDGFLAGIIICPDLILPGNGCQWYGPAQIAMQRRSSRAQRRQSSSSN
jgi:hypothetical protein